MNVLPIITQDPPHSQYARIGAKMRMRAGEEFYLANRFADVRDAMDFTAPFQAAIIVGLKPVNKIINPTDISTVEEV